MVNYQSQVRLVLIIFVLFLFASVIGGPIDAYPLKQRLIPPDAAQGGDVIGPADTLNSEPSLRVTKPQRGCQFSLRFIFLPLLLLIQKTQWRKLQIASICHHNQTRFAQQGKPGHPQLAPPVLF